MATIQNNNGADRKLGSYNGESRRFGDMRR